MDAVAPRGFLPIASPEHWSCECLWGTGREKNRTQTQAVLEKNLTVLSVRMGRFRDLLSACHLKGPEQFVPMSYTPVTS